MRPGVALVAAGLALAGCGHKADGADGNVALTAPVADQAAIARFVPPTAPSATPKPRSAAAVAATPAASTDAAATDALDGSAAAAQAVATRYFADIAAHRYADAWGLWSDHGKASGRAPEAFAADYRRYRTYHATVGAPRNPGGGGNDRFIVVPVRIDAIDQTGHPVPQAGTLTMHRIGGAAETGDPSAHLWRINVAAIGPIAQAPGAAMAASVPAHVSARYVCTDGFVFRAAFNNLTDRAVLSQGGRQLATLSGQRPGSGIWYAAGGWSLRGKGRDAQLVRPNGAETVCHAD